MQQLRLACHLWRLPDTVVLMDEQARFEAIYRAYGGAVRRYVRRRWDARSTDDVVADVFLVAWRRLGEVPDDPLPWLLGVARWVLANRRRGAAREGALFTRLRSQPPPGPSCAEGDEPDGREPVRQALAALSERDREVLLLVAWEGLTPARAARVLGIGTNTCAARLYRARRRFRRALDAASSHADREFEPSEVLR
jgi:RNA polymerase sigma-70 factor (ECF subfamily)